MAHAAFTSSSSTTHNAARALDKTDIEILRLLAEGMTSLAIARQLELSERTVRRHLRAVCDELHVSQPIEAVVWAVRHGIV